MRNARDAVGAVWRIESARIVGALALVFIACHPLLSPGRGSSPA